MQHDARAVLKKGPFVDDAPAREGRRDERGRRPQGHQDVVAPQHGHARHGRPHARGARRPQARAGVRHRSDGRAQARRVRADPHVPVPRRAKSDRAGANGRDRPRHPGRARATVRYLHTSPYKVRQVLDARPRPAGRATPSACCSCARRTRPTTCSSCCNSAIANAEHNHAIAGRRAVRRARVGRRGPDPQVGPAARPRPLLPHPQAHVARHDRARALRHRRARGAAPRATRRPGRGAAVAQRRRAERVRRSRAADRRRRGRRRPKTEVAEVEAAEAVTEAPVTRPTPTRSRTRPTSMPTTPKPKRRSRAGRRRRNSHGSKSQPVRVPARYHHRVEVTLDRGQEGIPRVR